MTNVLRGGRTALIGALLCVAIFAATKVKCRNDDYQHNGLKAQFKNQQPESKNSLDKLLVSSTKVNSRTRPRGFKQRIYHFELPKVLDSRPLELQLASPNPKPQTYGVIVDCGSSGTRAHLYHWDTDIDFSLQMLHDIEKLQAPDSHMPITKKITPGLSALADSTREQRLAYIKPLISFVAQNIPASRHKFTGVYFMATAGMRLLAEHERDSIMRDIRDFVHSEYNFATVKTSVISGTDEGMYQWISINAKGKRFLADKTDFRTKTFSIIEMGGASLQVTYQLRPGVGELTARGISREARPVYWKQVVEPAISRSHILEHNYTLHSTTFLGLGANSAREAYMDLMIRKAVRKKVLLEFLQWFNHHAGSKASKNTRATASQTHVFQDPCLPRGYCTSEPLKKPARMLAAASSQTVGFILDDKEKTFVFYLVGTGNYDKCRDMVALMLKTAKKEKMFCRKDEADSCTMSLLGEKFVPFDKFDFVAISGFYYAFNNKMIADQIEHYEHKKVVEKTKTICNMSYQSLVGLFGKFISSEYMISACFRAVWAQVFLIDGLKMPENFDSLEVKSKINNDELDWTLGAILDKSLAIERATVGIPLGSPLFNE